MPRRIRWPSSHWPERSLIMMHWEGTLMSLENSEETERMKKILTWEELKKEVERRRREGKKIALHERLLRHPACGPCPVSARGSQDGGSPHPGAEQRCLRPGDQGGKAAAGSPGGARRGRRFPDSGRLRDRFRRNDAASAHRIPAAGLPRQRGRLERRCRSWGGTWSGPGEERSSSFP